MNLLDGLRDLKAPLASGTVTLFALWLAFANGIADVESGNSLAGNIRRLAEYLGVPATLGIVAFVAYILGLVLSLHKVIFAILAFVRMDTVGIAMHWETYKRFRNYVLDVRGEALQRGVTESEAYSAMNPEPGPGQAKESGWREHARTVVKETARPRSLDETSNFDRWFSLAANEALAKDVNLVAAQLQTAKEKTYEQYDKAKTEADFRAALVLPLLLVAVIVGLRLAQEGLPWGGAGVLVGTAALLVGLALTARSRLQEANQILVTALVLGHVDLPALVAVKRLPQGNSQPIVE